MLNIIILLSAIFSQITITSPAFKEGKLIPEQFTCEGKNISPELNISGYPENTVTLALIMHDPDAPMDGGFTHWVAFNIDPVKKIEENTSPGTAGKNSSNKKGYTGPCPPTGTHHYKFKVYALDAKLDLKKGATKAELEKAMEGHILSQGLLTGLYKKTKTKG
ncbi:MAG: YbhB/YbcL family Raf kinase inhibitor-like protein [Bacteroidia bacterium]|nr:YbhB/YbcL family Raf kinase inhibitor-like protein [Bacteroidia bacterium]